jgi:exodeoxyribonuclease VII large subunit
MHTIKELNDMIKNVLTDNIKNVNIKGEISNLKITNNNSWFSLKDKEASINCVNWNNMIKCVNGDNVNVEGYITVFVKNGSYLLVINTIENIGIGDIHKKYEIMKKTCYEKGLFSKKRELPINIMNIGIITSQEGAALHDILYVLKVNNYMGNVYVKNCFVQGQNCSKSVCEGITYFNNNNINIDVILITRGGGAIEDLMSYSTPEICEAIYNSNIITISAIGHEVDNMLSDYAADIRAPTPTYAGELILKSNKVISDNIILVKNNMDKIYLLLTNKYNNINDEMKNLNTMFNSMKPHIIIDNMINNMNNMRNNIYEKLNNKIKNLEMETNMLNNIFKNNLLKNIIISHNNIIIQSKKEFMEIKNRKEIKISFMDGDIYLE